MNIGQYLREALESLVSNKLRSALTVLGIVIGVAAVIAMLAIGRGAETSINDQINSIGTNLIYITSGAEDVRNPRPLTLGDAGALADPKQAPDVLYVAPVVQGAGQVSRRGESISTSIVAVTPEYELVRNLVTSEGSGISQANLEKRAAVAVLGSDVAQGLFGRTDDLVGEIIRVQGQPFRVIGVLESKGGTGFGSEDDQILVPLTTAQSRLVQRNSREQVDMILVQGVSTERLDQTVSQIEHVLASRHRTPLDELDFSTLNQQDILDIANQVTGVLTIFLGGIAAISLLVGGIGIMNIMLVTVSERTREIGLRKAVGARSRDILVQFLAESAVLSLLGGILGIMLAWLIALIVGAIAAQNDVAITPVIEWDAVLLATLFSAAVGLFFGFYPARRASSLQPVEALRYE
jgi:putative ABC transport system permease protein